jgi:alpha-galactosidase
MFINQNRPQGKGNVIFFPETDEELPPMYGNSNVAVHELAVQSVLERDRDAAFHAVAVDPLTAAVLDLDGIREMFEELWEAEGDLLDYFG